MKCLSVRQPWASLLVSGVKDVENRTWATHYRGKLLIHASSKKIPHDEYDYYPYEWYNSLMNAVTTNAIPSAGQFPYSAIIGYVTLKDCITDSKSIWAQQGCVHWVVSDAYLFDTPILNVKGQLNVFEYPEIDENNLPPAHKADGYGISLEGSELVVKTSAEILSIIMKQQGNMLCIFPTPELRKVLGTGKTVDTWKPRSFDTVRFDLPDDIRRFRHDHTDYFIVKDEQDNPCEVFDLNERLLGDYTLNVYFGEEL